jgi:hypothetical protein
LEVYNGLFDWVTSKDYSGKGIPLSDGDKTAIGAVTVHNKTVSLRQKIILLHTLAGRHMDGPCTAIWTIKPAAEWK